MRECDYIILIILRIQEQIWGQSHDILIIINDVINSKWVKEYSLFFDRLFESRTVTTADLLHFRQW